MTMLANDDAVESVVFGDDGIIGNLRAGRDPYFIEYHQCLPVGEARSGPRESGTAFRGGAGVRSS